MLHNATKKSQTLARIEQTDLESKLRSSHSTYQEILHPFIKLLLLLSGAAVFGAAVYPLLRAAGLFGNSHETESPLTDLQLENGMTLSVFREMQQKESLPVLGSEQNFFSSQKHKPEKKATPQKRSGNQNSLDFLVSPDPLDQLSPVVAYLGSSDKVVVLWTLTGGGASGQFVNATTQAPIGARFVIASSTQATSYHNPYILPMSWGFAVALVNFTNQVDGGILINRYDADAQPIGAPYQINQNATGYFCRSPAIDGGFGHYMATWGEVAANIFPNPPGKIYATSLNITEEGVQAMTPVLISQNTTEVQQPAVVNVSPQNSLVFWQGYRGNTTEYILWGRMVTQIQNNLVLGSTFAVTNNIYPGIGGYSVARLGNGDVVVVWTSVNPSFAMYAQIYNSDGTLKISQFRASGSGYSPYQLYRLSITATTDGFFVAVSGYGPLKFSIYGWRFLNNGTALTSSFRLSTNTDDTQDFPTICSFPGNRNKIIGVWQANLGSTNHFNIGARVVDLDISPWLVLLKNTLSITQGRTSAPPVNLNFDVLNLGPVNSSAISILLQNVTNGGFFYIVNGSASIPITNFTLGQLQNGLIQFTHNGSPFSPSYYAVMTDGISQSSAYPATVYFTPINPVTTAPIPKNPTAEILGSLFAVGCLLFISTTGGVVGCLAVVLYLKNKQKLLLTEKTEQLTQEMGQLKGWDDPEVGISRTANTQTMNLPHTRIKAKEGNYIVLKGLNPQVARLLYEKTGMKIEVSEGEIKIWALGFGNSGRFWVGRDLSKKEFVGMKTIENTSKNPTAIRDSGKEISLQKAAQGHPNIMALIDSLDDTDNDGNVICRYLVMPLAGMGNGRKLQEILIQSDKASDGKKQQYLMYIAYRLLHAFAHLKQKHIVHLDFKLENFVVDNTGKPFVIDWGCGKQLAADGVVTEKNNGDISYYSPERIAFFRNQSNNVSTKEKVSFFNGYAADMWALGVTLFKLATGKFPFMQVSFLTLLTDRDTAWYQQELNQIEELKNSDNESIFSLIKLLLEPDPEKRIKPEDALKHPFFASVCNMNDDFISLIFKQLLTGSADQKMAQAPAKAQAPSRANYAAEFYAESNSTKLDSRKLQNGSTGFYAEEPQTNLVSSLLAQVGVFTPAITRSPQKTVPTYNNTSHFTTNP